MSEYEKIISKQTFNALLDNFENVDRLVPKVRKGFKFYVKELQQENELLHEKLDEILKVIDNDIKEKKLITYEDFESKIHAIVDKKREK